MINTQLEKLRKDSAELQKFAEKLRKEGDHELVKKIVSKRNYLNQRIASICQRKVISGPVEGATYGNIMVQAIAMGKLKDINEGRKIIRRSIKSKVYHPGELTQRAEKRYLKYLEIKQIEKI